MALRAKGLKREQENIGVHFKSFKMFNCWCVVSGEISCDDGFMLDTLDR